MRFPVQQPNLVRIQLLAPGFEFDTVSVKVFYDNAAKTSCSLIFLRRRVTNTNLLLTVWQWQHKFFCFRYWGPAAIACVVILLAFLYMFWHNRKAMKTFIGPNDPNAIAHRVSCRSSGQTVHVSSLLVICVRGVCVRAPMLSGVTLQPETSSKGKFSKHLLICTMIGALNKNAMLNAFNKTLLALLTKLLLVVFFPSLE